MEILEVEVVVEDVVEDEEDEDNLTMSTMAQADSEETILTGKQITWFKSGKNHQAVRCGSESDVSSFTSSYLSFSRRLFEGRGSRRAIGVSNVSKGRQYPASWEQRNRTWAWKRGTRP